MKTKSILRIIALAAIAASPMSGIADDADVDGIDDAIENQLLQRFAPVLYPNEIHNEPAEGVGVPVSISWLLRNSQFWRTPPHTSTSTLVADRPSVAIAINLVSSFGGAADCRLSCYNSWGVAPGTERRSWPISIGLGEGVYGRVWKPWPAKHPQIYSVQYYILLTWNETAYSRGNGNHESDWVCVDYAIDVRSGYENPPIIHAIYHCHGPQNFVTPEALEFESGHPVVYLEKGTNEAWPNRGGRGFTGWPRSKGFETNGNWDNGHTMANFFADWLTVGTQEINEDKVIREHWGDGNRYATRNIPNIGDFVNGDRDKPMPLGRDTEPNLREECMFLLKFQGRYGSFAENPTFSTDVSPPPGPSWGEHDKMWDRKWVNGGGVPNGPWTPAFTGRSPFSADTTGFYINTLDGFTFSVPALEESTFVNLHSSNEGDGSSTLPYKNLLLGIAMTADNGTVAIQPGSSPAHFTINQPVTLTAPSGTVTIGQ